MMDSKDYPKLILLSKKEDHDTSFQHLKYHPEQLKEILTFSKIFFEYQDWNDLSRKIAEHLRKMIHAEQGKFYQVQGRDHKYLWNVERSHSAMKKKTIDVQSKPWWRTINQSQTLHISQEQIRVQPQWLSMIRTFFPNPNLGIRSFILVPIRQGQEEIMGLFVAINKYGERDFTQEDEDLLKELGQLVVLGLRQIQNLLALEADNQNLKENRQRLEQRVKELNILYRIQKKVPRNQWGGLNELIFFIGEQTLDLVHAQYCIITIDGEQPTIYYIGKNREEQIQKWTQRLENPHAWRKALQHHDRVVIYPIDPDSRICNEAQLKRDLKIESIETAIMAPLFDDEQVLGCLQVIQRLPKPYETRTSENIWFSEPDRKLMTLLSTHAIVKEIRRSEKEQEQRLAVLGQMLSSIIHDLKTPFTVIKNYARIMVREEDKTKRRDYAERININFITLDKMIREILAFARGESSILLRKVHINKLMTDLGEMLQQQISDSNIQLSIDVQYRGPAKLDEIKMKRVFSNLLRNAMEAMEGRGRIEIKVYREDRDLVMEFSDNGPGIQKSIQDRLFESFVTEGKKNGTGLGLAIVKKIITQHGGTIDFTTAPGQGTTFIMRLPLGIEEQR